MSTTEKILEKQYFNVKDDIQQQTKFKKKKNIFDFETTTNSATNQWF